MTTSLPHGPAIHPGPRIAWLLAISLLTAGLLAAPARAAPCDPGKLEKRLRDASTLDPARQAAAARAIAADSATPRRRAGAQDRLRCAATGALAGSYLMALSGRDAAAARDDEQRLQATLGDGRALCDAVRAPAAGAPQIPPAAPSANLLRRCILLDTVALTWPVQAAAHRLEFAVRGAAPTTPQAAQPAPGSPVAWRALAGDLAGVTDGLKLRRSRLAADLADAPPEGRAQAEVQIRATLGPAACRVLSSGSMLAQRGAQAPDDAATFIDARDRLLAEASDILTIPPAPETACSTGRDQDCTNGRIVGLSRDCAQAIWTQP